MISVKIFETVTDTEIIQKIINGEIALFEILIRRNNVVIQNRSLVWL